MRRMRRRPRRPRRRRRSPTCTTRVERRPCTTRRWRWMRQMTVARWRAWRRVSAQATRRPRSSCMMKSTKRATHSPWGGRGTRRRRHRPRPSPPPSPKRTSRRRRSPRPPRWTRASPRWLRSPARWPAPSRRRQLWPPRPRQGARRRLAGRGLQPPTPTRCLEMLSPRSWSRRQVARKWPAWRRWEQGTRSQSLRRQVQTARGSRQLRRWRLRKERRMPKQKLRQRRRLKQKPKQRQRTLQWRN
mmetsp:Transcript_21986/g.70776  ORF Transcript_21986/g.70776 Transcript_21986/m.70776 type:complete len:244 (+) Transcript_21986:1272-2003(+)